MSSQLIGSLGLPESGQNSVLHPTAQRTLLLAADWQIRPLLPSDSLEQLTELIHRAHGPHLALGLRFVGTYQTVEVTAERIASGHAFVATAQDELIGTVTVRPPRPQSPAPLYRDPHTWSFSQLAVTPELKGRGLGRALHDAAVQCAPQNGARTMMLDTAEPAQGLRQSRPDSPSISI